MAIQKPSKPNVTLPNNFGGVKTPYTQAQIDNGYQEAVPQVVDGGNINYEKDGIFQKLKYAESIADVINGTPVKKVVEVDANNNFDYSRIGVYAYETTRTFSKDEISVSVESDGQVALYRSLANNNKGNSLKNGNFWEQISLGSSDVTQYDFMANKADFAHAKYNSTSYEGLSYIDMWHMQATSVFAKDRFVLEPCLIRLVADGKTHYYHNFQAQEIIPSAILDSGTTLQAGKEYYVYVVWDSANSKCKLVCSLNSSYPQGYSATTSRKIIWFHTLCAGAGTISGHIANGYAAADIIPNSIACLGFRPKSSPDGMVYIDVIDHWADIYLQSGTGINTASVFGGTVTDTRYYQNHVEDMMSVDKILPNDVQFTALAWGSNQKTAISGAKDWGTTGGHVDTSNRRMIGQYFVEDACGFMWQYLNSTSASGGAGWTDVTTDLGSGSFYGNSFVLRAGGDWADGAHCGVSCRNGSSSRSTLRGGNSCRGLSQNIRMNLLGK